MQPGALLRQIVDEVRPQLEALEEEQVMLRKAPGKWSLKEILGHLIDSAANNHQRFVRAVDHPGLVFDGYDQDRWVQTQQYHARPWREIVALWHAYNMHLAHIMQAIPEEVRQRLHATHNLDRIAMRAVPSYSSTSLEYLMRDYIWHLEHHLGQVLPGYERRLHW
ncbi:MAG: DinB family protein [Saprospiraceae bacterium]|nr:DinB family protein [Saprospiraceae bacterium]